MKLSDIYQGECFYSDDFRLLIQGKMEEVLPLIAENSVDAIVTDPPYELGFMGKSWDSTGVAFKKETWERCFKALKPGGYLLAFGGSRTHFRIACAIEDAGFEIRDEIMWLYGSGFPKSENLGIAIDKSYGKNRERQLEFTAWMRSTGISAKTINNATGTNMASHFLTDKEEPGIATADLFDKLRPFLPEVPERIERLVAERTGIEWTDYAKREKIADRTSGEFRFHPGEQKENKPATAPITAPHSEMAKKWDGWGNALKPAYDPVIVARKPFKGSLASNVMNNGVGAINVDECKVASRESEERFPSNVIIDGSDSVDSLFESNGAEASEFFAHIGYSESDGDFPIGIYCTKAGNADRDAGLMAMEEKEVGGGRDNPIQRDKTPRRNIHPTVKPVELMRYLIRLVAPKGAIILDPFMGSGSTGKAVALENLAFAKDYKFIGVEMTSEYLPIAKARIVYAETGKDAKDEAKEAESGFEQLNLFGERNQ